MGQKFRRNCSISLRFQDKLVFAFNAEIQDGRQEWRENDFCEKSPVDSANTLRVKSFVEIALSHTVSEINVFMCFTQKFKMAAKNGKENDFWENSPVDSSYTLALKNFNEIALSRTVFEIFTLFYIPLKSKMAAKSSENFSFLPRIIFYYPWGRKFAQNRSICNGF